MAVSRGRRARPFWRWLWVLLAAGCGNGGIETGREKPEEHCAVRLQTDWYAQGEHGGFYQALAGGYYEEEGLDVEILQGGPNAMTTRKVLQRRAHFAMHRADAVIIHIDQGLPLQIVCATLQHDPQAILLHEENPIDSLAGLDGQTVMAVPGLSWISYLKRKYKIGFTVIPGDFGMERFLADKSFIQQCLATNEPFFVRRHGANPKVLLLSESGFDPYHVVYARRDFLREQPGVAEKFVRASIKGWREYLYGDPSAADARIIALNPRMTPEFLAWTRARLVEGRFAAGDPEKGENIGLLKAERIRELTGELLSLGLIERPLEVRDVMTSRFLPRPAAQTGK